MNILTDRPIIADKIKEVFGIEYDDGNVVITYGDSIYNAKGIIHPSLVSHENTHINQQIKYGVEKWWERYFIDPKFRLDQELEAYRNQYKWLSKNVKDREIRNKIEISMARDLSGKMYGNLLSFSEALNLIKQ